VEGSKQTLVREDIGGTGDGREQRVKSVGRRGIPKDSNEKKEVTGMFTRAGGKSMREVSCRNL